MGNVDDRERPPDEDSDEWDDGSGEALEELIEHADRASGAESFGTTADEQERGEPLGERLARFRVGVQESVALRAKPLDLVAIDGLEQRHASGEVAVQRSAADTGIAGDVVE